MYTLVEVALSIGVLATLVTALSACVCGCKNNNQKSELVGTAGVVKIRLDEEVPSPTPTTPASIKRASTQNSQRSLPEIPHPVGRHDSGDTASEIYATVNLDEGNKALANASTSRDHPYEHAYAKLQTDTHNITVEITPDERSDEIEVEERDTGSSAAEGVLISASVAISGQLPSSQELPYITPPSPRPDQHFSGDSTDSAKGYTSISVREPLSNIRAQSTKHPHYATVSDDSDEMYAAIEEASVGEGSDTYAQIAPEPRRREAQAQLHAPPPGPSLTVAPPPTHTGASSIAPDHAAHHARRSAPPEIGASTSNATHSRQASMSSCSNSSGALGSPKPEKRQANSPLPPPPSRAPPTDTQRHHRISSTGDLHFNHDKLRRSLNEKHQRNNSCVSSSDFYGCNYPVEKHRFSSGDLIRPLVAKELNFDIDQTEPDNVYNSIDPPYGPALDPAPPSDQRSTESPSRNIEEMYAKVMKKAKTKESKDLSNPDCDKILKYRTDDPGYETIDRKQSVNHGYETIARKERQGSNRDPGYETVRDINKTNSTFTNNNLSKHVRPSDSGPSSVSSDAGYEHIAKTDANTSDSDPNYEVLRNNPPTPPYATIAPHYQPPYSTINKPAKYNNYGNNNHEPTLEPNYESMTPDPYTTGSESDPNYESLRCKDPKYESVRSKDSKYDSVRSKKDPNYESVKYFELSKLPYETVAGGEGPGVDRSDSAAGYERINIQKDSNSVNNGADCTVSDYFQV